MNKPKKILSIWEHYIAKEVGIEFKSCLYFFCILFYYSVYRLTGGIHVADILHMTEMILLAYGMGYVQMYLLSNFDEGDHLRGKEIGYMLLCTLIYTGFSYLFKWFDKKLAVTIGFAFYIMLAYICAFLVYKTKRDIDEKLLNDDLKAFQERKLYEECDRD